jgi:aldehyde dehydrogenase (NAD+)
MAWASLRENINPSDMSDIVGEYAQADKAQTEAAIAAAKAAQPAWAATTPQVKADALEFIGTELLARKDEIGRLLSREEGKPLANGIAETMRAAQIFKFFAQETLRTEGVAVASVRPASIFW